MGETTAQTGGKLKGWMTPLVVADLSLLFVAIMWGASYAVAKDTLTSTTVAALIFSRFLIALLVLLPVCFKELCQIEKSDAVKGIFLGVILSFIFLAETAGVMLTTATNAAFLISLCILFTPVLDSLLKLQFPPAKILGCAAVSMMGTGLMVGGVNGISFDLGDLSILCAAVLRAIMVVSTKLLFGDRKISTSALTLTQALTVTVLSGAAVLITDGPSGFIPPVTVKFWGGLLFLALFCTLSAFFIQNWALRRTSPTRVGFLMGTEPIFGAAFAILLLSEVLTPMDVFGAFLILCGTYLGSRMS